MPMMVTERFTHEQGLDECCHSFKFHAKSDHPTAAEDEIRLSHAYVLSGCNQKCMPAMMRLRLLVHNVATINVL